MNDLEQFKRIKNWILIREFQGNEFLMRDNEREMFDTVENSLKTLHLIEDKKVDLKALFNSATLEEYHKLSGYTSAYKLTQEEYDSLRKRYNLA